MYRDKGESKFFSCASRHVNIPKNGSTVSHIATSVLARGEWSVSRPYRFTPGEMAHGTLWSNAGWDSE